MYCTNSMDFTPREEQTFVVTNLTNTDGLELIHLDVFEVDTLWEENLNSDGQLFHKLNL